MTPPDVLLESGLDECTELAKSNNEVNDHEKQFYLTTFLAPPNHRRTLPHAHYRVH